MAKRVNEPRLELAAVIGGLEESLSLCRSAQVLRARCRESGSPPDSTLPTILNRYLILDTLRLFEPEHPEYPTRSLPAALNYLRFHADYLEITGREAVTERLARFGHDPAQFEGIPDPWITQLLLKEFADRLPRENAPVPEGLSAALRTLHSLRDRSALERSDQSAVEQAVAALLAYAADFVETLRRGYL